MTNKTQTQHPDGDLTARLGPGAGELSPSQIERVRAEDARIQQRYPDRDQWVEREAALAAVVQHLLGTTTLDDVKRALIAARLRERETYVMAEQIAVMLHEDGMPEATAARSVGIDRMSLRKALGKR